MAGDEWFMATSLWETFDGGLHWQHRADPCGEGLALIAVSFPTRAVGRALCLSEPSAGFQAKAVYGTSDGGAVWHLLARAGMPPSPSPSGLPAAGYGVTLEFPTADEGFLLSGGGANGDVWARTTDGGRRWVVSGGGAGGLPFAEYLSGVSFPTPASGYVSAGGFADDAVYHTTDGGRTWTQVSPVPPQGTASDVSGAGATVDVTTAKALWRNGRGGSGAWTRLPAPPGEVAVAASRTLFAVAVSPAGRSTLWRSVDGGASWRLLNSLGEDETTADFVTAAVGFLFGPNGVLYRTTDGGAVFRRAGVVPARTVSLAMTGSDSGWAVAGGRLYRTDDGGRTWTPYRLATDLAVADVSFADPSDGMVIASNGPYCAPPRCRAALLTTADGGARWTSRPLPGLSPSGLALAAAGHAVLMAGGYVLVSSDGGAAWTDAR